MRLFLLWAAISYTEALYTYFETLISGKSLGPSRWGQLEGSKCGGSSVVTGFGQSPVAIDSSFERFCDTNLREFSFQAGDCEYGDYEFKVTNHGATARTAGSCNMGNLRLPGIDETFQADHIEIHALSEQTP